MAFRGWPIEAVEFYEGLEADNSKVYWTRHRPVYDRHVKAPMEELLAELAEEFGTGTLFRPHRDVRFSADKAPYKTNCAARLGSGYVSFSADGLSVGSGLYMPDPAALARYRSAVDAERSAPSSPRSSPLCMRAVTTRWPTTCSRWRPGDIRRTIRVSSCSATRASR